ncbi:MAG: hypothetical protein ACXU86_09140, partial [Archangium sp.]
MSKPQAGWLAWVTCAGLALASASCSKHPASEGAGTGGSGKPAPLGQASARLGGKEITLEVDDLRVGDSGGAVPTTSSFVTGDPITARGDVPNGKGLEAQIQWHLQPVGPQTGDA